MTSAFVLLSMLTATLVSLSGSVKYIPSRNRKPLPGDDFHELQDQDQSQGTNYNSIQLMA